MEKGGTLHILPPEIRQQIHKDVFEGGTITLHYFDDDPQRGAVLKYEFNPHCNLAFTCRAIGNECAEAMWQTVFVKALRRTWTEDSGWAVHLQCLNEVLPDEVARHITRLADVRLPMLYKSPEYVMQYYEAVMQQHKLINAARRPRMRDKIQGVLRKCRSKLVLNNWVARNVTRLKAKTCLAKLPSSESQSTCSRDPPLQDATTCLLKYPKLKVCIADAARRRVKVDDIGMFDHNFKYNSGGDPLSLVEQLVPFEIDSDTRPSVFLGNQFGIKSDHYGIQITGWAYIEFRSQRGHNLLRNADRSILSGHGYMNYSTDLFWTTRKDGIWRGPGHGCGDPYEGYQRVIEASYKPRAASSSFDTDGDAHHGGRGGVGTGGGHATCSLARE